MHKITVKLGGNQALGDMESYAKKLDEKIKLITERLAMIGVQEASVRFGAAIYDGINDTEVEVKPIDNGWKIVAKGQAVFFIEFGSGVYHNTSEPYPLQRPTGIAGIGEYGQGKGKRQAWGYYDSENNLVITRGNPAAMPMYYASLEIEQKIREIAKEVFL